MPSMQLRLTCMAAAAAGEPLAPAFQMLSLWLEYVNPVQSSYIHLILCAILASMILTCYATGDP